MAPDWALDAVRSPTQAQTTFAGHWDATDGNFLERSRFGFSATGRSCGPKGPWSSCVGGCSATRNGLVHYKGRFTAVSAVVQHVRDMKERKLRAGCSDRSIY